jgi:hypothetical protein
MENTSAQSTQKLSAPQFSLKYVDYSYDVPPVYGINPYNGNTEIKQSGYHVYKEYVEVWIKNPSFQQYTDASGHKIVLGYQVYWKGHYGDLWANATYPAYVLSSGSEYTVISFAFGDDANDDSHYWLSGQVSTGDQLDFKAATFVGYYNIVSVDRLPIFGSEARTYLVFTGQTSDWSSEQTILLDTSAPTVSPDSVYAPKNAYTSGNNSPTATPTPQPIATTMPTPTKTPTITPSYTPTNSNLQLNQSGIVMIIVGVVTAVVAALSLIYFKQHKNF